MRMRIGRMRIFFFSFSKSGSEKERKGRALLCLSYIHLLLLLFQKHPHHHHHHHQLPTFNGNQQIRPSKNTHLARKVFRRMGTLWPYRTFPEDHRRTGFRFRREERCIRLVVVVVEYTCPPVSEVAVEGGSYESVADVNDGEGEWPRRRLVGIFAVGWDES